MKVQHPTMTPASARPSGAIAASRRAPHEFRQALAQALKPADAAAAGAVSATGLAAAVELPGMTSCAATRPQALSALERLLDAMTDYQRRLEDPRASLRTLQTDLDQMQRRLAETDAAGARLPDDDALRRLVDAGTAAATAEIARFQRGDYC
jgi:hypothetical protein